MHLNRSSCQFSPHYTHALKQHLPIALHWDNPQWEECSSREVIKSSAFRRAAWKAGLAFTSQRSAFNWCSEKCSLHVSVMGDRMPSFQHFSECLLFQYFYSNLNRILTDHGEERKESFDLVVRGYSISYTTAPHEHAGKTDVNVHTFGAQISKGPKTFLNSNCLRSALHSNPKRNCYSGMSACRKPLLLAREKAPPETHHMDPMRSYWQAAALLNGKKKAQQQLGCYQLADNKMCWAIHPDTRRRNSNLQLQAIVVLSGQLLERTQHIAIPGSLSLSTQHAFRKLPN